MSMLYQAYQNHMDLTEPWRSGAASALKYLNLVPQGTSDRLFTRLAALMIWIEMSVIITVFQWQYGYFWTNRGIEYALLWWLLCIAIVFRGGGRYSLDRLIGKEL